MIFDIKAPQALLPIAFFMGFLSLASSNYGSLNNQLFNRHLKSFQPSLASHTRSVVHDVPVGIIPSRFWEDYSKPDLPSCDVCFY